MVTFILSSFATKRVSLAFDWYLVIKYIRIETIIITVIPERKATPMKEYIIMIPKINVIGANIIALVFQPISDSL